MKVHLPNGVILMDRGSYQREIMIILRKERATALKFSLLPQILRSICVTNNCNQLIKINVKYFRYKHIN